MRCHICGGRVVVVQVYDIRIVRCNKCGYTYEEETIEKGGDDNDRPVYSEPRNQGSE